MKAEYDFSKGRRGQAIPTKGKTRITIYLDDAILAQERRSLPAAGEVWIGAYGLASQ